MFGEDDPPTEIVPTPKQRELAKRDEVYPHLKALEDQVFAEATEMVNDMFHAFDVGEGGELDPEATEGLDDRRKKRRTRAAQAALLPTKEVPYVMKAATDIHRSIARGRMNQKGGDRVLNIQVINMPAVTTTFPELEVAEDG